MTTFLRTSTKPSGSILCVDDDDDDASLLEAAAQNIHDGIRFMKCYGGREALEFLVRSESKPDLILLDVNMPLVNGFECLKQIQKNPKLREIPVFMLSTSASAKDVSLALQLGARRFLTKPNTYREICDMMTEIIEECLALK